MIKSTLNNYHLIFVTIALKNGARDKIVNIMNKISKETQEQAMKVAKGIQRPNQTKEQTKLISQGIEKGIAEYKKQQSKKSREQDKTRKAKLKSKPDKAEIVEFSKPKTNQLPWLLLAASWLGFVSWYLFN